MRLVKRRWYLRSCVATAALLAVGLTAWGAGGGGTAPPPQWDDAMLQAFSKDARTLLGPGRPGGAMPVATGSPAGGASGSEPAVAGGVKSGGGVWSTMVSADNLEAIIKGAVTEAAGPVKSPTDFKSGGHRDSRVVYSTLAVIFGVIDQYDGDVRWKQQANGLRRMFSQAGFNCKTSSDASYKEAKLRSDDLATLVRGGSVEIPSAEPQNNWAEIANRPPLMTRMEQIVRERLGNWLSNSSEMSKNRDAALREAQLLAVLAEVIKHEDYEFGDDDTYLGYIDDMQTQTRALIEAINQNNHDGAQSAMSLINKSCDTCHGDYRG